MAHYPQPYVHYLIEFHATRDYFECHEIMEEFWKERGADDPHARIWVGLIRVAVAQYHHRRGNIQGASKMLSLAIGSLEGTELSLLALDGRRLLQQLTDQYARLTAEKGPYPFNDMNLPITDPGLIEQCKASSEQIAAVWGMPSTLTDDALVHRHRLRDRTEVIEARSQAAATKRRAREGH
ncbi:DUF309 domain-containing protein [Paenibacillaceae bacterium]|nr:DUF309 domain-containing protein [Paenibacillaceae bacterium]